MAELGKIIVGSVVGFAVFACVVYSTIELHKRIESRLASEEKKFLNILIAPRDIFNLILGSPFFLFFLVAPFILDTEWIGIFILDVFAYCALVVINGGFFLTMAIKGYIGVIWGLLLGAVSVGLLGVLAGSIFQI